MSAVSSLWASVQGDPAFMRKLNGWLTIVWFVAALPICLFLANSVPFLVFISVYAVVTGHWATWQASRVEVRQEEDADVAEVLRVVKEIRAKFDDRTDAQVSGPDDLRFPDSGLEA